MIIFEKFISKFEHQNFLYPPAPKFPLPPPHQNFHSRQLKIGSTVLVKIILIFRKIKVSLIFRKIFLEIFKYFEIYKKSSDSPFFEENLNFF